MHSSISLAAHPTSTHTQNALYKLLDICDKLKLEEAFDTQKKNCVNYKKNQPIIEECDEFIIRDTDGIPMNNLSTIDNLWSNDPRHNRKLSLPVTLHVVSFQ